MPKQNRIYFPEGGAFKFVGSDKVPVKSITGQSECDCEVDCCLKAIKLPDHDGTGVKYIYIFEGQLSVGTKEELIAESTIL